MFYPVIAPFPHVDGKDPVGYAAAGGFVIFKQNDAEKKKMVFEFAEFLTNQQNLALLESLSYLTARDSVNKVLYQNDPYMNEQVQEFAKIMDKYGMDFFGSQEFPFTQIQNYFTAALEAAFSKTKTPQKALDDFVIEANRVLDKINK